MDYSEALGYLYSLQFFGVKLGLDNIEKLTSHLGSPQARYPSIHVAGTNGKGSVASMIASCLACSGERVGLFTSPHLERFEERISIQGRPISPAMVVRQTERVRVAIEELMTRDVLAHHPTFFEVVTAMAFLSFEQAAVDVAVIEAGLGGRFDATNVLQPVVSVITSVSYDHMAHLGNSLEEIAGEKAGIIKPGVDVITDTQDAAVTRVLSETAKRRSAHLTRSDEQVQMGAYFADALQRCVCSVKTPSYRLDSLALPLPGLFQLRNARLAICAVETFARKTGLTLGAHQLRKGIEKTRWPGRLEILSRKPLVVIDCAHNLDAARMLAQFASSFACPSKTLVFALMKGKDLEGMTEALFPCFDRILLTKTAYERALDPFSMRDRVCTAARMEVHPQALKAVAEGYWSLDQEDMLCVAGSCFLVGEVRAHLRSMAAPGT